MPQPSAPSGLAPRREALTDLDRRTIVLALRMAGDTFDTQSFAAAKQTAALELSVCDLGGPLPAEVIFAGDHLSRELKSMAAACRSIALDILGAATVALLDHAPGACACSSHRVPRSPVAEAAAERMPDQPIGSEQDDAARRNGQATEERLRLNPLPSSTPPEAAP